MKEAVAFAVVPVLIPLIVATECKSEEYPPDYTATKPVLITDTEGNNEDPFLLRAKDGTIYLVWFSERGGNADIYMKTSKGGNSWSEDTVIIKGGGANNFYPSLAQTNDGMFHLTWFRIDAKSKTFSICYANSDEGKRWSKTQAVTPRHKGYNWVPTILAANDGSIWIAWSSGRTGNKDVFVVQSKDGGKTWQEPVQVTKHKNHDDLPNIAQKPDGTFVVVWTNYVPEKADYLSKTADIYYATSKDGQIWSEPIRITKNSHTDTIPEIYSNLDQSEFFVAWCSPTGIWDLPLSDLRAEPKHLLGSEPGGYSPRVLPLTERSYLVVWTGKNKKAKQIYRCQIEKHEHRDGLEKVKNAVQSPYSEQRDRNARKGGVKFVLGAFALHRLDSGRKAGNALHRRDSDQWAPRGLHRTVGRRSRALLRPFLSCAKCSLCAADSKCTQTGARHELTPLERGFHSRLKV